MILNNITKRAKATSKRKNINNNGQQLKPVLTIQGGKMTIIFLQIILIIVLLKIFKNHTSKPTSKPTSLDDNNDRTFNELLTFEELLEDEENPKKWK